MKRRLAATLVVFGLAACAGVSVPSTQRGLVEYAGAQREIFVTGKAVGVVPVRALAVDATSYAVGAAAGLDGEITVLAGVPYVTKVRGDRVTVARGWGDSAFFAVWARQAHWTEQPVPAEVRTYQDLQRFVKARAQAAGLDTSQPFPFRLTGTPPEVDWHVNVDRTGGQPITTALFLKSKASYVARDEPMDLVGFYSEHDQGVFITGAPTNAMHVHMVTRDGRSAGHVDAITLGPGMTLLLPRPR